MTARSADVLGIHPGAGPAWFALGIALNRMEDDGHVPVCRHRPEQWSASATEHARRDAAEACEFCPARAACHAFAQANQETSGVWGGRDFTPIPRKRKAIA